MSGSDTGRVSRLIVAAAVLDDLEHPTTLLCTARSYPPGHADQFELPGGKVEPAEEPEQALIRGLGEEIGLGVRLRPGLVILRQLAAAVPSSSNPGSDAPAWPAMHGFRMRIWLAEPAHPGEWGRAGGDHQHLEWVRLNPPDQLRRLPWLGADLSTIDTLAGALGC